MENKPNGITKIYRLLGGVASALIILGLFAFYVSSKGAIEDKVERNEGDIKTLTISIDKMLTIIGTLDVVQEQIREFRGDIIEIKAELKEIQKRHRK